MRRALMWILLWTSDLLMWIGFHRSRAWWWCIQTAACFEEWNDRRKPNGHPPPW